MRQILNHLNLKLMIKSLLINKRVFLVKVMVKIGQKKKPWAYKIKDLKGAKNNRKLS